MTDVQRRLNSFEERLRQVQTDITGLQRSHQNLQRSVDGMRSEMNQRFDALDARFASKTSGNHDRGNAPVLRPVRAHRCGTAAMTNQIATKADVRDLKAELKTDIGDLRASIKVMDGKIYAVLAVVVLSAIELFWPH